MTIGDGKVEISDAVQAASFYVRHRETIWAAIILIVGLFGGNVDRIYKEFSTPNLTKDQLQLIEERLNRLEMEQKMQKILNSYPNWDTIC